MPTDEIVNQPGGGKGGDDFGRDLVRHKPVKSIRMWYGKQTDADYTVLKALQVEWEGEKSRIVGSKDSTPDALETGYDFDSPDKVKNMMIRGAPRDSTGRCDSISFQPEGGDPRWSAGGIGGQKYEQNTGNGTLIGFVGAAHGDIDRLGAVFTR